VADAQREAPREDRPRRRIVSIAALVLAGAAWAAEINVAGAWGGG
jgi:hypothetical protein